MSRSAPALWLLALSLAACDDDAATPADATPVDAAPGDAAPDRALDLGRDAAPDLDAAVDADPDRALDAAPDLALDAAPDLALDATPDAERRDVGSPFRDAAPVDPIPPCTVFECACEPGDTQPCYPGPPETEGVGPCVGGQRTCAEDGSGFGPCEGARPPLGEDCRTPEDDDCDGETPPCSDTWVHTFASPDNQAVRAVAVAPDGDVLALLDYDHGVNLGAGYTPAARADADVGIGRWDRQGNPIWSRTWGAADDEFASQLAVGPAGEVLVLIRIYGALPLEEGYLDSSGLDDIALLMLEPDGRTRWTRHLGGAGRDGSERVSIDAEGRVLLTGRISGEVRFGERVFVSAGGTDAFAAVFDGADGALLMARQAGGEGADSGWGIARGAGGVIYVAGRFEGFMSWGGDPVASAGAGDVFVTALEADGAHRWTRRFGGAGDDGLYDMVRDPESGALYLFGWFTDAADLGGEAPTPSAGSADYFVMRLEPDGGARAVAFGDAADQTETPFPTSSYAAMALGPDGLYLAGPFAGGAFGLAAEGGVDGFAARLDRDLVLQEALAFGTGFSEMALDVAVDPEGGAFILGGRYYSREGPRIGPHGPLAGAANSDGFVVRLVSF